jgi:hypothetical protein
MFDHPIQQAAQESGDDRNQRPGIGPARSSPASAATMIEAQPIPNASRGRGENAQRWRALIR